MNTPCVQDEGLHSQVPETGLRMTTFVESFYRVGGDLEVLREGLYLEPAQFHAAMAFYCANKDLFDAEYERIMEERQRNFAEFLEQNKHKRGWAALKGAWRGGETDEEVEAALERLS